MTTPPKIQLPPGVAPPVPQGPANVCPFSLSTHLIPTGVEPSVIDPTAAPSMRFATQNTFSACSGAPCAVWSREKGRCGLIAPTADEIGAALARELRRLAAEATK